MKRTEISSLGEFGLIDRISEKVPDLNKHTIKGIGDDAAVLDALGKQVLLSTDMLVEGIHFDLAYVNLNHLGYKSVIVNLSDIYAMNAIPKQITVSIAVSNRFSVEAIDEFYDGVMRACARYEIDLVGGDTTSSNLGFCISISVIGYAVPSQIVYRNGAQVGDLVCVTGDLGAAYLGLHLLQREKEVFIANPKMQPELKEENAYLLRRFLLPEARKDIIDFFAQTNIKPTAMMDISDGLSSEILHICRQSRVGALLEEVQLPIHDQVRKQAFEFGIDTTVAALSGGEDYELLFTIAPKYLEKIANHFEITVLGEILPEKESVKLKTKSGNLHQIIAQGWKSF
ncbi:MAG: thiamine-phosphate kinase [Chitinophagales bacterium]|jgi:thiamine-monophosphate kinase|nr:thiamine-phosphate kinase [Chitinophagales bacterium]